MASPQQLRRAAPKAPQGAIACPGAAFQALPHLLAAPARHSLTSTMLRNPRGTCGPLRILGNFPRATRRLMAASSGLPLQVIEDVITSKIGVGAGEGDPLI